MLQESQIEKTAAGRIKPKIRSYPCRHQHRPYQKDCDQNTLNRVRPFFRFAGSTLRRLGMMTP